MSAEAIRDVIGPCREWVEEKNNRCNAPTEYVLWGKLIDPEGLGPRCYDHAAKWVGHYGLYRGSGYALINLDDLFDAASAPETQDPFAHFEVEQDALVNEFRQCWEQVRIEIRKGEKKTHWIWFIFPQLAGLGKSETAKRFELKNLEEAQAYLRHDTLSRRLAMLTEEVVIQKLHPGQYMGTLDSMKLRSSMTLFSLASGNPNSVFQQVLDKWYNAEFDPATVRLLVQEKTNAD